MGRGRGRARVKTGNRGWGRVRAHDEGNEEGRKDVTSTSTRCMSTEKGYALAVSSTGPPGCPGGMGNQNAFGMADKAPLLLSGLGVTAQGPGLHA